MPTELRRLPPPDAPPSTDHISIERANNGFIVRCSSMGGDEPEKSYAFTSFPDMMKFAAEKLSGGDPDAAPMDAPAPPAAPMPPAAA